MTMSEKEQKFLLKMPKEPCQQVCFGKEEQTGREFPNKRQIDVVIVKTF